MPHTLLLADDSITIQRVIELTFADEDIRVVSVGDGQQAIASMTAAPPDIVLADVGMPVADGYAVARHMRSTPALSHIPLLLLTGAFEPVDAASATEAGCQGVLMKPFEPMNVIQRVKELLGVPPPAAAAPAAPVDALVKLVPVEAAPRPPAAPESRVSAATTTGKVEAYFDELDAAFAKLPGVTLVDPPRPAAPPPAPPPARVPLADAFTALLAAERAGASPSLPPGWPALAADREALIEEVVRRVLERIGDSRTPT